MQKKEVKKWQDEEALKRYRMIAPLLDEEMVLLPIYPARKLIRLIVTE